MLFYEHSADEARGQEGLIVKEDTNLFNNNLAFF